MLTIAHLPPEAAREEVSLKALTKAKARLLMLISLGSRLSSVSYVFAFTKPTILGLNHHPFMSLHSQPLK